MTINNFLIIFNNILWNRFLIFLIIITGLFFTITLRGVQFKYFFTSLKLIFSKNNKKVKGDISQFQSLMLSLAATIGIGSITGMATAIIAGGFGSIFWMWVVAIIGMATKYAESILAIKFRTKNNKKEMSGGPMYYIQNGLNKKILAYLFAIFGSFSALAGGNLIQAQSISDAAYEYFNIPHYIVGIFLVIIIGFFIMGGIKQLGKINSLLVPIMGILYISAGLIILIFHFNKIGSVFSLIFKQAFSSKAVIGGVIGGNIMMAIQMGIARGISSNEAGLGSSPIASAAAKTSSSVTQGLIAMSSVFISSFIICPVTVLVLGVTGVCGQLNTNGSLLNGAALVMHAFKSVLPHGDLIVFLGLLLFGFSTILGWAYYGEKCFEFVFGESFIITFRIIFILFIFLGSILSLNIVWVLADIFNGLMTLPNLIGVIGLYKIVIYESKYLINYKLKLKKSFHT